MREELKEIHELKRLLTTTRLTQLDRKAIEARIQELMSVQKADRPQTKTLSPYLLGTFDRPTSAPPSQAVSEPSRSEPLLAPPIPSQPPAEVNLEAPARPEPPVASLSPDEIERRCRLLAEIADRIVLLRALWATTLSFEVTRDAEAWLSKLQEIARTIPEEAAERALGRHAGFLTQAVQPMTKPQIPEALQERLLPPSVPSDWNSAAITELYFTSCGHETNAERHRPANSLPDGLDQFIL